MKRKGASDWGSIYLLVVVAIAAVLLVTFVKPLFKSAGETAQENLDTARDVAGAALFLLTRNKK
ncbi:hypothetical protein COX85_01185 [Candidatus Micrarchaeota archaeon CG_4_10_14_0_2_um_filter_55_9]|nr:MAG: hypothetical protein COT57_03760 [Candidatus Micrarchaeota archaeon CG09_land_8_20_14_0_10_55_25]PIZ91939.1 MAG: hypothetical protein COX85_01185 [Candidatus Micrarchaeota archaeon CG_4_10_14_0_2_um_filter_55_9]